MNTEQELEIVESMFPHTDECRTNIKEAKKLNLTSNCMCDPLLKEKRIKLISLINKHYVRKEGIDELLEKVLELFVQEPSQKNAVFVSPEQQLRHQADLIEAKDNVAERFRQLVDSLIKDKEEKI